MGYTSNNTPHEQHWVTFSDSHMTQLNTWGMGTEDQYNLLQVCTEVRKDSKIEWTE